MFCLACSNNIFVCDNIDKFWKFFKLIFGPIKKGEENMQTS